MTGPTIVGPYEVLAEIARGGMAVVYRARDPRLDRVVALKILGRADEAGLRRFEREATGLAGLNHPNVVTIHEAGQDHGRPWLAMELVEGGSLQDRLDRSGPLDPTAAAACVAQLADALAHCHGRGVLHRDLKPDNVLLDGDRPLLTDFGLIKDLSRLGQTQGLTQEGTFFGTPGYWSPEQAAGQTDAIGPATDVYGLGAILYALLTGRPPTSAGSLIDALAAARDERPVPPGTPLDAICLRCLEKDPSARYRTPSDLAAALRGDWEAGRRAWPRWLGLAALTTASLAAATVALTHSTPARDPAAARDPIPTSSASPAPAPPPIADLLERVSSSTGEHRIAGWLQIAPRLPTAGQLSQEAGQYVERLRATPLARIAPRAVPVESRWSPDGRVVLLTRPRDGDRISFWTRAGERAPPTRSSRSVSCLEVVPGLGIVHASALHALRLLDPTGGPGEELWRVPGDAVTHPRGEAGILGVAYAPRQKLLAVVGGYTEVFVVEQESGQLLRRFGGHTDGLPWAVAFSANERYVITLTNGGRRSGARVYDLQSDATTPQSTTLLPWPGELAVAPAESVFAIGNKRGEVLVLDPTQRLRTLSSPLPWILSTDGSRAMGPRAHAGTIVGLAFLPSGQLITVSGVHDPKPHHRNMIRLWDPRTGKQVAPHRELPNAPRAVDLSPDGHLLLIQTKTELEVWAR